MSGECDAQQGAGAVGQAEAKLALAAFTLECLAADCMDSIEMCRADHETDNETQARLLRDRFRLMGAQIDAVLRLVNGDGIRPDLDTWLLSPREIELAAALRGAA